VHKKNNRLVDTQKSPNFSNRFSAQNGAGFEKFFVTKL
jgi:hypothetical protein